MQGRVIEVRHGQGRIMADDGQTYAFAPTDVRSMGELTYDARVDFIADGDRATQVFMLEPGQPVAEPRLTEDSRRTGPLPPRVESETFFGYFIKAMTSRYADFNGRARRTEFWSFILFSWLSLILVFFVSGLLIAAFSPDFNSEAASPAAALGGMIIILAWAALVIPNVAIMVRRLHDVGLSGWFVLIGLIFSFFMLVIAFIPSQATTNKWGQKPR